MDIAKKYTKLDPRQHVLTRPGMYIGSIEKDAMNVWVLNDDKTCMVHKNLEVVPGLYKIFDEILVNAIDHVTRLKQNGCAHPVRNIKVTIDKETGVIEVYNDGDSIDVEIHPEHNVYIPEMIFGNLMTSTNYDENEERIIGGQNGIGAKACNIFSSNFRLELVDHKSQKMYVQEWSDNMDQKTVPKITKSTKKPYTKITFKPDYVKFNVQNNTLTDDMFAIFQKRVYDVCALTDDDVSVHLNGEKLSIKNFERYVDLYIGARGAHPRVYQQINDRWEVVATYNESNGFDQVSFVNGVWTVRGGKHVEYVSNQICSKLAELIHKRRKVEVKPQHIKNYLSVFIKCTIVNPTFDSQTKDLLTTPMSKFGSKPEFDDAFIEKLYKTGIVDYAVNLTNVSDGKQMKKSDGKKQATLKGIVKLDDANWAGTTRSKECTLILTEGDSAKAMALSGLDVVGRDKYGVFPLRGKLLNVKDCNVKKLSENEEITNIKRIMGLESGKAYESIDQLRYGRIMIMTDADEDGAHIKGLLFNMFHTLWPTLFKTDEFICALRTPIIKVRKGQQSFSFYTLTEYDRWREQLESDIKGWTVKYYKGLATSNSEEAKEYFREMKLIEYQYNDKPSDDAMDMAFNKKRADDRKEWLSQYDSSKIVEGERKVVYEDFVNKELIHFSNYDVERSIPNMIDGFKTSQRKIMYGCFKRKLTSEIRVAQLAAYVSEHSAYHHGEASLQAAIINMAQDFVGSNNINLLQPNGQFGTRVQGGKNAGSPRYIYTLIANITPKIFRQDDAALLEHMDDDGFTVEPRMYYPIIPMILVNGALGIGTGFSTNIPCYNPIDIIDRIKGKLTGEKMTSEMIPWYRGFKGSIEKQKSKWLCFGKYKRIAPTKVEITEIPVGTWTEDYKEFLESLVDSNDDVKAYVSNSGNEDVNFVVTFANEQALDALLDQMDDNTGYPKLESFLKLTSTRISTTNMYLFNAKGQITKYETVEDILDEYYDVRLDMYEKRRRELIRQLENDLLLVAERIRFLELVISRELVMHDKGKKEIEIALEELEFVRFDGSYDYLLRMPMYNMTRDKQLELKNDHDTLMQKKKDTETTTASEMWLLELEDLRGDVAKLMEPRSAPSTTSTSGVKRARKGPKENK